MSLVAKDSEKIMGQAKGSYDKNVKWWASDSCGGGRGVRHSGASFGSLLTTELGDGREDSTSVGHWALREDLGAVWLVPLLLVVEKAPSKEEMGWSKPILFSPIG